MDDLDLLAGQPTWDCSDITTQVDCISKALPVTPLVIPEWLVVAAIHGSGSLLLGPHRTGAQAFIPPAVLARTPEGCTEEEYSDRGWRIAIWRFVQGDLSRVDSHRPVSLRRLSLLEVLERIRAETPEYESWLHGEIQLRAQCLATLVRYADAEANTLAALRSELDDLLLDCTRAIGFAWVSQNLSDL